MLYKSGQFIRRSWAGRPHLVGQVINESLGQVPKKLVSRPARAGKDQIITDPIGYETGWTIARSLGEVGTTSVHSNPVFACNDCTFLKCKLIAPPSRKM